MFLHGACHTAVHNTDSVALKSRLKSEMCLKSVS